MSAKIVDRHPCLICPKPYRARGLCVGHYAEFYAKNAYLPSGIRRHGGLGSEERVATQLQQFIKDHI